MAMLFSLELVTVSGLLNSLKILKILLALLISGRTCLYKGIA